MNKIYIWGAGIYLKYIYPAIDRSSWTIEGIIDSNIDKQGQLWNKEIMIYSPQILDSKEFDYIIISPLAYEEIEKECKKLNIPENKVISYWKDSRNFGLFENWIERIVREYQENAVLKKELRRVRNRLENTQNEMEIVQSRLENAPYEWGLKPVPKIKSGEELLKKIMVDKSSLSRFGDGEFEIMRGRERSWFQNVTESLSNRLTEVISSDNPNLNIAIMQNYTGLENFKEIHADSFRRYMAHGTREDIISFLDPDKEYYDAYVSRPYIIYKSSENAKIIFHLFQKIWKERNVILVEGKYARIGIGNDLLSAARGIKRIICPPKNAWDYYDAILEEVEKTAQEDDLICISLGPTATVLAYDLAIKGLQALDIGQLDNEYDWYIRNAESRVPIPGKMVAEVSNNSGLEEFDSAEYRSQIVCEIG